MPHHPSLSEVMDRECSYEWMTLSPQELTIKDWVDSRNGEGDRYNMEFFILCGSASSEYGTYSFLNIHLNIYSVPEKSIQTLEGQFPLGSINYCEDTCPTINVNLSEALVAHLLRFIANNLAGFRIKVSIPKWVDETSKCLPLLSYQVFYEQETKI